MKDPHPKSTALFARAQRVSPGGVHSPVRAFGAVGGTPLFIEHAAGATLTDADGRTYTDYCMAFGPLPHGHAAPHVAAAVSAALSSGWSYGTAERWSLELAELINARIPWAEQIRFVNSGTEAVMSTLRLARAVTGRELLVKFSGCYHGHCDSMLVEAGSGLSGQAMSAGIPADVSQTTLVLPLDDVDQLTATFAAHGEQIAAAIIEPLPANHGLLPQRQVFLQTLRECCSASGALLIFDEVISGFRVAFGGCAELSGITPDLVTWGKIIGGGFPVGAYAGQARLMQRIAPSGDVYQAGTLSANPAAMRAGQATLHQLAEHDDYSTLETLGEQLDERVAALDAVHLVRAGSVFWLRYGAAQAVARSRAAISTAHAELFPQVHAALLAAGIYTAPSPWEVGFLSTAHTAGDIDRLGTALADCTARLGAARPRNA